MNTVRSHYDAYQFDTAEEAYGFMPLGDQYAIVRFVRPQGKRDAGRYYWAIKVLAVAYGGANIEAVGFLGEGR